MRWHDCKPRRPGTKLVLLGRVRPLPAWQAPAIKAWDVINLTDNCVIACHNESVLVIEQLSSRSYLKSPFEGFGHDFFGREKAPLIGGTIWGLVALPCCKFPLRGKPREIVQREESFVDLSNEFFIDRELFGRLLDNNCSSAGFRFSQNEIQISGPARTVGN